MALISLKAIFYDWFGWNIRFFEVLNTGLPEAGQPLAHIGSALGNYWAAPFMLTALVLWARQTRRAGSATSATKISIQAYRFGWACLLALLVTGLLKWGLDFARPGTVLGHGVRILAPVERSHGFPSGHSVYAALVLCALWPLVLWPSRILLLLLLLWVGYARVAMGAHFPADVVAGWIVGASCLLAAGAALSRARARTPTTEPSAFINYPNDRSRKNNTNEIY